MILVFSQIEEPSTDRVVDYLNRSGVESFRINYEEALLNIRWSCWLHDSDAFTIEIGDKSIDLSNVDCVWNRRWGMPLVPKAFDQTTAFFSANELNSFFNGFYFATRGAWVNDLNAERTASNKLVQLMIARRLGASIPATLVSSKAQNVTAFYEANDKDVIFKATAGSSPSLNFYSKKALAFAKAQTGPKLTKGIKPKSVYAFTQLLDKQKLEAVDTVKWAPVTFQKHIRKQADVRVTVFGDTMIACKIFSQDHEATTIDFRRMLQGHDLRHEIIELPAKVTTFIERFMHVTELDFGCFDFIIERETGAYVFLECNPNGQWLWIEQLTRHRITELFGNYLIAKAAGFGKERTRLKSASAT